MSAESLLIRKAHFNSSPRFPDNGAVLESSTVTVPNVHPVVVIGGGLNGLSTLFHLLRLGVKRPLLIERFQIGHDRGSSHGPSRIARSTYPQVGYVRLMRAALAEEWPRLERAAGERLLFATPGLFFGPPRGPLAKYAAAVAAAGADVQRLDAHEARSMFPLLRFSDSVDVLHDRTAAVIASARTIRALERLVQVQAEISASTRVLAIDVTRDPIRITTDRGIVDAERLVITAGPWTTSLLPFLEQRMTVMRQSLAFFDLDVPRDECRVGRFPVFAWLGEGDNDFYYGLPEFDHPGVKLARHVTHGRADDPDAPSGTYDEDAIEDLRALAHREFVPSIRGLAGADTCMYTCTRNEDFVIDLHPDNPRVVVGAGFSGHGFKFGPLVGRILAELSLFGACKLPEFEAMRREFGWRSAEILR